MSSKASLVIGLGFGDEGKGLTTDYLCSRADKPLVIRFNGGQQAGHTVCLPDGRRHVFSNFGSGTLRGSATYWSSYCTCALPNLLREYEALLKLNVSPRLYLDKHCAVTTHYDVLYNRLQEQRRSGARHGSCGMGFGVTVQRQETGVSLLAEDLLQPNVCATKLTAIRAYYTNKAKQELNIDFGAFEHDTEDARLFNYLSAFQQLINEAVFITTEEEIFQNRQWNHYVFEGAQGILLDMDFGYFPHVTRSYTTSKNALEIIARNKKYISSTEIFYASRIYHSRHGEGPFVQGKDLLNLKNNEAETNVFNDYQGNFKTGPLDINKMQYALDSDDQFSKGIIKNLILTCLDQVDENNIVYSCNDAIQTTSAYKIPLLLKYSFNKILMSRSTCSESIMNVTI